MDAASALRGWHGHRLDDGTEWHGPSDRCHAADGGRACCHSLAMAVQASQAAGTPQHVPSARTLVKASAVALAVAGLLLVTIVFPAEYGIDPLGTGEAL